MSDNVATIGFIGLGRMGYPMTLNLLRAGYRVRVYDLLPERIATLVESGATPAASPRDAARGADLVLSMILDDAALEAVALGPEGVLAGLQAGAIYADMSTVSPMASRRVADEAGRLAVPYLRAKVSGSIKPAVEGKLTIFASGPRDAYERCLPVFAALGKASYYVGPGEEAIYLKLVHSIMVGIYAAMVAEAFTFGESGGTDWRQMIDVIDNSAVGSTLFNYKAPLLRDRDYAHPQSTVDVAAKDIDMALAAADELGLSMPITTMVRGFFATMQARDQGRLDFIGIVRHFEELAGIEPVGS